MGSSLWAGIAGLNASSKQMDVIGNNIANVNTIGFKGSKTFFSDVLSQSLSGGTSGSMQVGRGVAVADVQTQFSSGSFETTGNATDLAIDGDGFFMVNDDAGGTYYTRAGAFHLDSDGYLVDANGYKCQGYNLTSANPNTIDDISLRNVQSEPSVTTIFSLGVNLNAETETGDTFNATQTVYDSLGQKHTLNMTFRKTEANGIWGVEASLDNDAATAQSITGVTFDSTGAIESTYTAAASKQLGKVNATGGATLSDVVINNNASLNAATNSTVTLTCTAAGPPTVWTVGGYGGAEVETATGNGNTVEFRLDGTVVATFDGGGTFGVGDTVVFDIAAAPTINREGQIYKDTTATHPITLQRGAAATTWTVNDNGGYANMTVTSQTVAGQTYAYLDLDGSGGTDITINVTGYAADDQFAFTLDQTAVAPVDGSVTIPALANGATIGATNILTWDLVGTSALDVTGYASTSVIKSLTNDGYASGLLKSLSVDQEGVISGFFTNGQTSQIGQVVLADFDNPWGLKRMGNNLFGETLVSGPAIQNVPGASGMGDITSNSIEMSNVDIATEFINMITAQKAYQASARVITTTDQLMQELMNIKR